MIKVLHCVKDKFLVSMSKSLSLYFLVRYYRTSCDYALITFIVFINWAAQYRDTLLFRNDKDIRIKKAKSCTEQILCIGTDRSQQTVQTKIRLLLKKQSDQGLRCLQFHQHLLDALIQCYIKLFYF